VPSCCPIKIALAAVLLASMKGIALTSFDYLVYLPINILPNAWRYIHISLSTKIIKIQEISASCRDLVKDIVSGKRCQLGGIAEYWAAVHQEKLTTQTSAGLN
jgi:hypothetical protein